MLTVHGIETMNHSKMLILLIILVATVLTVHGIETDILVITFLLTGRCNSTYRLRYAPKGARRQRSKAMMRSAHLLPERSEGKTKMMKQQHLPFTVLKHSRITEQIFICTKLQQYLPFTVCTEGCETAERR